MSVPFRDAMREFSKALYGSRVSFRTTNFDTLEQYYSVLI